MIERFHRYHDGLASGAQPSVDDLAELKNTGWEVVVNLSPASTKNALADEARVLEEGVEPMASLAELQTIQSPEPKWFTYFDAMGIPQGANQR